MRKYFIGDTGNLSGPRDVVIDEKGIISSFRIWTEMSGFLFVQSKDTIMRWLGLIM